MNEITPPARRSWSWSPAAPTPNWPSRWPRSWAPSCVPTERPHFANGEIYARFERVRPRLRHLRHPVPPAPINKWLMEQLIMVDALKRASRQADHRRRPVLPLRPPGQEGPRPRADLRPPRRRPVQDRRRGPHHERRPARRPDPGLLRRPGRPPVRHAGARSTTSSAKSTRPRPHRRLAGHRPRPGGRQWADTPGGAPLAIIHKRRDPNVAEPGRRPRDRRPGRGPGLPAGRRHDRHRRHDRPRPPRRSRRPGPRTSSSRRPTPCSPTRPPSGCRVRHPRGRRDRHPADPGGEAFDASPCCPIAPLIARAIREVFEDGSVTSLFDGAA